MIFKMVPFAKNTLRPYSVPLKMCKNKVTKIYIVPFVTGALGMV